MKTIKTYHASVSKQLFLILSLGMVVLLIVGAFFVARPVQAATVCTTTADGIWTDAIWDCGSTPGAADDVVILHFVALDTDQEVHSLSIKVDPGNDLYGTLQFTAPVTLTIDGDFSKDAYGVLDPGNDWDATGGTVILGSGNNTIITNGAVVDFYNLTKVAIGAGESLALDPQGALGGYVHVLNALTLKGVDAGTLLSLTSTSPGSQWGIESEGTTDVNFVDVTDSNNVGPESINVADGSDGGNNTGWSFGDISSIVNVSLASSDNPINPGHEVTFTATITPSDATGTVEFKNDGSTILYCESQPVSNGTATCETESLVSSGDHAITAVFTGSGSYDGQGASSDPLTQTVQGTSAVTVNVTPGTIVYGNDVTLTAKISPPSASAGHVSFKLDGVDYGGCENQAVSVVSGVPTATCAVGSLTLGNHSFSAMFHSDNEIFAGSTSPTVVKTVKYASTVGISSSLNPSRVGMPVILTATLNTLSPSAGGTVNFKSYGVTIAGCGSVAVVNGIAMCQINPPIGSYNITVEYGGDAETYGSSSVITTQVVNSAKIFLPRVGR